MRTTCPFCSEVWQFTRRTADQEMFFAHLCTLIGAIVLWNDERHIVEHVGQPPRNRHD